MTIYLYVKQHTITGLKYFGKTTKKDPFKYNGSGLYWKKHLKKHGNSIKTLDVWGFDDIEICTQFAIQFSQQNNIVESKEWANLIPENGLDGGSFKGRTFSKRNRKGIPAPNFTGHKHTEESKEKTRQALLGKKKNRTNHICPHCGLQGSGPNMIRYHYNNCKFVSHLPSL